MKDFRGKVAVVTGGGTGMGRELARQLASEGCDVAICEYIVENMLETKRLCEEVAPAGTRISAVECDVADEAQVIAFRDAVKEQHDTEHINLLFNNAGVGGGMSYILSEREEWDRTFAIDWFGVYYCTRAFMPMLLASTEGWIVNTSSVNGFWACLGPQTPHTAYSTAKFAVKGFTESLQVDLKLNAPHIRAAIVMPGHIGTSIGYNTSTILGHPQIEDMTADRLAEMQEGMARRGFEVGDLSVEEFRESMMKQQSEWRENAPLSPAQAATIILDGVRNGEWRILVGEDAKRLDQVARAVPETLYELTGEMMAEQMAKLVAPDGAEG